MRHTLVPSVVNLFLRNIQPYFIFTPKLALSVLAKLSRTARLWVMRLIEILESHSDNTPKYGIVCNASSFVQYVSGVSSNSTDSNIRKGLDVHKTHISYADHGGTIPPLRAWLLLSESSFMRGKVMFIDRSIAYGDATLYDTGIVKGINRMLFIS